jgi:hypothetical protein
LGDQEEKENSAMQHHRTLVFGFQNHRAQNMNLHLKEKIFHANTIYPSYLQLGLSAFYKLLCYIPPNFQSSSIIKQDGLMAQWQGA